MTDKCTNSGKHNLSTEDLLNDYLNDVFGSDCPCTSTAQQSPQVDLEELDEEFIELDTTDSNDGYRRKISKPKRTMVYENVAEDEPIVVSEHTFDLLPQERKGAVEKFCVNRLALYHPPETNLLFSRNQFQVKENGVREGHFLIPIIDFSLVTSKCGYRSPEEAHLLLLNSLYYLRRPLPEKVRKIFLNYGEQALDDFHAAEWLAQFQNEVLEGE